MIHRLPPAFLVVGRTDNKISALTKLELVLGTARVDAVTFENFDPNINEGSLIFLQTPLTSFDSSPVLFPLGIVFLRVIKRASVVSFSAFLIISLAIAVAVIPFAYCGFISTSFGALISTCDMKTFRLFVQVGLLTRFHLFSSQIYIRKYAIN